MVTATKDVNDLHNPKQSFLVCEKSGPVECLLSSAPQFSMLGTGQWRAPETSGIACALLLPLQQISIKVVKVSYKDQSL